MSTDPARQLAKALRLARVAAGLSQIEVAERVSRSRQAVSAWEREDDPTTPAPEMLDRLAELYGVDVEALRGGSDAVGVVPLRVQEARKRLSPRVYEVVYSYLERMRKARLSPEQIDAAERIMTDSAYSQLYARAGRSDKSEEDQIMDIHAFWKGIAEIIERTTGKTL